MTNMVKFSRKALRKLPSPRDLLRDAWFMLRLPILLRNKLTIHEMAETLGPDNIDRIRVISQRIGSFIQFILKHSPQFKEYKTIEIPGHFSIRNARITRAAKRKDRKSQSFIQDKLGDSFENDDRWFDFLGIRWMHDGRWGEDHPIEVLDFESENIYKYYNAD